MEIKELVQEVRNDNHIIKLKQEELERLKRLCEVAGIKYGGERTGGSRDNSKHEKAIMNYIEYKDSLAEYILEAIERRKTLTGKIDQLKNKRQLEIMYAYSISSQSFGKIARDTGISKQRVSQIYNEALEEIQALDET